MEENTPLFIAVEGPIGIGKTSLANCLASHYSAKLLKEIVYENPFLDKFYDDLAKWSFQTEMFFLTNRYQQLSDIQENFLAQNIPIVSDYHLLKNLIFANLSLNTSHLDKFNKIYNILESDLPKPNVIIVLNASLETIMTRIKKRNRHFEQNIDVHYLESLIASYGEFTRNLKNDSDIPVVELNGDLYDFVENPDHLREVLAKIDLIVKKEAQ